MLRKVGDQPTLWKALLFAVALVMPAELERVDQLLDDDRLFDSIVANLNVIGLAPPSCQSLNEGPVGLDLAWVVGPGFDGGGPVSPFVDHFSELGEESSDNASRSR